MESSDRDVNIIVIVFRNLSKSVHKGLIISLQLLITEQFIIIIIEL